MSIPLNFGLWWSGSKLSYFRYLTFKSLRHFHPDSNITLYTSDKFRKDGHRWGNEKQDFESNIDGIDYLSKLSELNINIVSIDLFDQYHPNFQSDFFRWWFLSNHGGFYLDTDQVILKSFDTLPLNTDFIYSAYWAQSCGYYCPVGVLGSVKNSDFARTMNDNLPKMLDINNYNSIGPFGFRKMLTYKRYDDIMVNMPYYIFYPIPESQYVDLLYNGNKFELDSRAYCLHFYGGHPSTQEFNKIFNREFIVGNDSGECSAASIAEIFRKLGIS